MHLAGRLPRRHRRQRALRTGWRLHHCGRCGSGTDWKEAFWGANYSRLVAIKQRHDPAGLFTVHHGVGSEI
ncbi:BBE domain-containing protein [Caballeronia sp.]|uniref:BBE domain-containing protein n=1 Tax=Caballeronia sp. TaxID=1931223 RepID=UPI003C6F41C0